MTNRARMFISLGLTLLVAAVAGVAVSAREQQPAQAEPPVVLKVDIVLLRDRPDITSPDDIQTQNALSNLARQEALLKKGLLSEQAVDAARQQLKVAQAQQAERTKVERISRLPYSLLVSPGQRTSLRLNVRVPFGQSSKTADGVTTTERQFQTAGTNIDCQAAALPDGRYRLQLSVEDTSIVPGERIMATGAKSGGDVAFRTLNVSNVLVVREGQTLPFSIGTDRITGETLRAEVTVTVVK